MKNKIILFVTGYIILTLSSCLNSDDDYEYEVIRDAQISSFSLSHDSLAFLTNLKFSIDQIGGRIFNVDSLPFGTEITEKLICKLDFSAGGVSSVEITPEATDSTFLWNSSDSINFSKPVRIVTTAWDGTTKKTYIAQINIHQIDPDTMIWEKQAENLVGVAMKEQKVIIAGFQNVDCYFMYYKPVSGNGYQLQYSPVSDGVNWTSLSLTGLPETNVILSQITFFEDKYFVITTAGILYESEDGIRWQQSTNTPVIRSILGVIGEGMNQQSSVALILERNEELRFAGMDRNGEFTVGEDNNGLVPAEFPLSGFGVINYSNMYHEHLFIIGGKDQNGAPTNLAWATMDPTYWARVIDPKEDFFEKRSGVMAAHYDDKFYIVGGIDESGKAKKDIYFSIDKGITWTPMDSVETKITFPEEYTARGYSSVFVDNNNYMLIFGGKTSESSNVLDQIWRGRINRLGFKD